MVINEESLIRIKDKLLLIGGSRIIVVFTSIILEKILGDAYQLNFRAEYGLFLVHQF